MWERLVQNEWIYKGTYNGWYSVRDEAFYDESEIVDGKAPSGSPVEWKEEETYFFKLSAFTDTLLEWYEQYPGFVFPHGRFNELKSFVKGGLRDLSVSRCTFSWGIPIPDTNHVMYVWHDALTTYISAIGFPNETEEWRKFWPASVHIIGKDIVRFHTVYWPAFLMSAGLPLPKMVFGHGFLLSRGEKMSKSLGNVVDPMALAELFGVDALRYFLLREVSFGQDGSYSPEAIVTRVNADLANSFGNLAQRTLSLIFKNCDGYLPAIHGHHADDQALLELVGNAVSTQIPAHFEDLAMSQALEAWMQAVFACNAYVDVQAPWALKKTDPERMETVLATLFICIAQLAIAVQPIIPGSATKLLDQMGVPQNVRNFANAGSHWYSPLAEGGFQIAQPQGLFPRLELPPEEEAST